MDALLIANSVEIVRVGQRRSPLTGAAAVKQTLLIRRNRFEVVHSLMMTSAVLNWPACKITRVPLVSKVDNDFNCSVAAMRVGQRVSGVVARSMVRRGISATVRRGISATVRRGISATVRRGISATRVRAVLNGTIGTPRYAGRPALPAPLGPASILFGGGMNLRKRFPDLLEAFDIVVATVPGATRHVVGEGPCAEESRAVAAAGPSAGAITFCGGIDDPRRRCQGADVFVLPSLAEPAGLVMSETCEAGCATVASDVAGIREMLDGGRTGMLVTPGNPARFAAAPTDPNCLQQGKRLARANVPRMSLARVAQETLDVFRECMPRQCS